MCYPKPGPRCSAHARKALVKAHMKKIHSTGDFSAYQQAKDEYQVAEDEYHMTPSGQRDLQRRIDRGDDSGGLLSLRKERFALKRKEALRALGIRNASDKHKYPQSISMDVHQYTNSSFPSDDKVREPWKQSKNFDTLIDFYIEDSGNFVEKLTLDEQFALRWYTSDGSGKSYQNFVEGKKLSQEDTKRQELVDKVFTKYKPKQQHVVYRGLQHLPKSLYDLGKDENGNVISIADYMKEKFPPGEIVDIPHHQSTSADPAVAARFTGVEQVIIEIKTARAIPVGVVSAWEASEREMIVQRGQKYRVVGVKTGVPYSGVRVGEEHTPMTVVQLEAV